MHTTIQCGQQYEFYKGSFLPIRSTIDTNGQRKYWVRYQTQKGFGFRFEYEHYLLKLINKQKELTH